jgi:hypothetical protein
VLFKPIYWYEENQRFFKPEVSSRSLKCIDTTPKLGRRGPNKEATDGNCVIMDIIGNSGVTAGGMEGRDNYSVTTNGKRTP